MACSSAVSAASASARELRHISSLGRSCAQTAGRSGRPKIAPVVLKKGYVNTAILWDWMKATMDGKFRFENASVVLMDDSGRSELARYNLVDCWPSRWAGWQLDANSNNAMVEEFELQVRTIERISAYDKTNLARAAASKAAKLAGKIG